MRRWLFNILSVLSLVLCAATGAAWVRSYWVCDNVRLTLVRNHLNGYGGGVLVAHGEAEGFLSWDSQPASQPRRAGLHLDHDSLRPAGRLMFDGSFRLVRAVSVVNGVSAPLPVVYFDLPLWAAVVPLLILPAFAVFRHRRRPTPGCYPRCRYDLRASKDRCPECGWSIPADFPRPNSGAVEQAKDGRDIPSQT
jgi:hypothetical protein